MKKILLILIISFCLPGLLFSGASKNTKKRETDNFLIKYRSNPFQWIFPEYYYKADVIRVRKTMPPQGYAKVSFFGISASIPSQYTYETVRKHDIMHFKSKTGDWIVMIKSSNSSALCSEANKNHMKDYCSAFKTPKEYNHKLFTLTPDTVENTGDKWIVHDKGAVFENTKKIEIYSDDRFMAYVKIIKDSWVEKKKVNYSHEVVLFHANGPLNAHITISFSAINDTVMKNIISTIE